MPQQKRALRDQDYYLAYKNCEAETALHWLDLN